MATKKKHSLSYSEEKSKYAKKFILKLLQARTFSPEIIDLENKDLNKKLKPYLTPQELEFGMYLITAMLSSKISLNAYVTFPDLESAAKKFALATDYHQAKSKDSQKYPSAPFIQIALKKLHNVGLIRYEYAQKKLNPNELKEYEQRRKNIPKVIKIKFLPFKSFSTIEDMYLNKG